MREFFTTGNIINILIMTVTFALVKDTTAFIAIWAMVLIGTILIDILKNILKQLKEKQ